MANEIFTLEPLEAKHGDALLLHYGPPGQPRLIIIDGGPPGVFKGSLQPRLEAIRTARGGGQLEVRMVLVSHIDEDHITGVLDLTKSLRKHQDGGTALPYDILTLWHNSFDDLIAKLSAKAQSAVKQAAASIAAQVAAASTTASTNTSASDVEPEIGRAVAASVNQGRQLRADADALALNLNSGFDDLVTFEGPGQSDVPIGAGLEFTIIGPRKAQIEELQKHWVAHLKKELAKKKKPRAKKTKARAKAKSGAGKKSAIHAAVSEPAELAFSAAELETASAADLEAVLEPADLQAIAAAFVDASAPNLSSIVILARLGQRTMLLTGDARGDFILESLKEAKLLKNGRLHVDILKVPHHGSERNMEVVFFKTVTADHYVFSANGKFKNPDVGTFKMLFEARPTGTYTLWLTNGVKAALKTIAANKPKKVKVEVRKDPALSQKIELGSKLPF